MTSQSKASGNSRAGQIFGRLENLAAIVAIRNGIAMIIPFLMIGSISLVLRYLPIPAYLSFLPTFLNGHFIAFLDAVYAGTFGVMAIYLAVTVAYCYAREKGNPGGDFCAVLTSVACFFLFTGSVSAAAGNGAFGVKGMFLAIVTALCSTALYSFLFSLLKQKKTYADGAGSRFNAAMSMLPPALIVLSAAVALNLTIQALTDTSSLYELSVRAVNAVFLPMGRSFFSALLYAVTSSILWFFGVHGSNTLEVVAEKLFIPALQINADLVAAGQAPTEIFTKQFFDVFVLMGGCGTAVCLLIALLLFGRRRSNRRLAKMAALPVLFNINEILVFGFPVVFNVTLFLPFILVPLVSFLTSYAAMASGLVPLITSDVNWTSPVLWGGYVATGSVFGSILQAVNIALGVMIYRPFLKLYEKQQDAALQRQYESLVQTLKESEASLVPVTLTELTDSRGVLARSLTEDIRFALRDEEAPMFYQPQFDSNGACIGAEALLRWKHPVYGMIYPPLVIQLAHEAHLLSKLEEAILYQVVTDTEKLRAKTGYNGEVSVNVSPATLLTDSFWKLLNDLVKDGRVHPGEICLEITEQTTLIQDTAVLKRLRDVRVLGYRLAIDDFSMGHTSLSYLQDNQFDTVKLDGSLIRGLNGNIRSAGIIQSIMSLSGTLGFTVLAECVETEEQMKFLEQLGCLRYQGYLYSPAVSLERFTELLHR